MYKVIVSEWENSKECRNGDSRSLTPSCQYSLLDSGDFASKSF